MDSDTLLATILRLQYNVISSTYIRKLKTLLDRGKSFMYIKNNSGPSTGPCGTSVFIIWKLDLLRSIIHHELLSVTEIAIKLGHVLYWYTISFHNSMKYIIIPTAFAFHWRNSSYYILLVTILESASYGLYN